ncbi:vascular cell adhesion protein 1-like [Echeneis naucrates]|uniref:Vascular cell adhesion protein 1-like n=1 Tax=Echeneis naucrates TaxID=173247 RepID=A0A665T6I2_ECHNA|nr:vascular cell adhesion protein 1-like [Echeneis naucrates]
MFVCGWPITLVLFRLFGPATSFPFSTNTPAPPLSSQILPPSTFPSNHPSLPSSLTLSPPISGPKEPEERVHCPLTMSPSSLVVRFGDPVAVNCSLSETGSSLVLGWAVQQDFQQTTVDSFLVWTLDRMNSWNIEAVCFALLEVEGQCQMNLPATVYSPPDSVSISFVDHSGPMSEGRPYTLQCKVQNVAPVKNLTVTFYKGQTALGQQQSNNTNKKPVSETFTLDIRPSKEDDGVQFWCEAKLELGPEGPKPPPVVESQKLNAVVFFGPHLICPSKLKVKEGESFPCEVKGKPRPSVTWYRDGQVVALPAHSNRKHAGKYTIWTKGLGQKNFTVEVEVLSGRGTTNCYTTYIPVAVLFIQMIFRL